jgi:hypothetical protein
MKVGLCIHRTPYPLDIGAPSHEVHLAPEYEPDQSFPSTAKVQNP